MTSTRRKFERGNMSPRELQRLLDAAVAELPANVRDGITEARVRVDEEGVEPASAIIIGIAIKAGSHVAEKVFDELIWPRLKGKLDDDSLGEEQTLKQ